MISLAAIMIFKDDGVGLPQDLDTRHPSSLGLTIVNALTGQLGGDIALARNGGPKLASRSPLSNSKVIDDGQVPGTDC